MKGKALKHAVIILSMLLLFNLMINCTLAMAKEEKVIRVAHSTSDKYPYHVGLLHFAKRVGELTSGKVMVKIFPNAQLGNEREVLEAIQMGTVDMTVVNGAVVSGFAPSIDVFNLPFIFKNMQQLFKASDGPAGALVAKDLEAVKIKTLSFWSFAERSIFNRKKPINNLDDLKGMKLRVTQSPISIETFNALGALSTPMAYGEVYSGLQQGVIDAAENDPISLLDMKFYEVAPYYSLTRHFMVACPLVINTDLFNKMPKEFQSAIQKAAIEGRDVERKDVLDRLDAAYTKLKDLNVKVNEVSDMNKFKSSVKVVYDTFARKTKNGPKLIQLVEESK
jgi:TRAP-type transport system periplasmic protein